MLRLRNLPGLARQTPGPVRYALCLVVIAALAACRSLSIESPKIDYKSTGKLPPLEVPPDLTRPGRDDRYVVPDVNPRSTATYSEYSRERAGGGQLASASFVLPAVDGARIERDGSQRWLVVKGTPEQLWPVVKDFWQESGFIVNREIPDAGVMETDWAENRAKIPDGMIRNFLGKMLDTLYSSGERDKFSTRLERGVAPGTTEIYISHRGMEEVYTTQRTAGETPDTRWQPRPPDPNLEAEMLRRLMVRLGVQDSVARQQLATGSRAAPRATLLKEEDGGALALEDPFDRAWRRVGLALDRIGFTVEDRDRSKGLYYVRYIDPQIDTQQADKGGWLSRLKFWGSSEKPKAEHYRILVSNVDPGSRVNVLSKDGVREQSQTTSRILTLLYEQLK